jgi:hypothetical protein
MAACRLGVSDAGVIRARLDALSGEFAFIEMLRERLLARTQGVVRRLAATVGRSPSLDPVLLRRTGVLAVSLLSQIQSRLADADDQTQDLLPALQDCSAHSRLIRAHRDSLSRRYQDWSMELDHWDQPAPPSGVSDALLARTHAFLLGHNMREGP